MAQGLLKKSKPATSSKRSKTLGPKKGTNGTIAPKKASLIKQQKITKKLTSGLVAKTERNLAQRAGHLELLAGGKKDRKGKDGKGKGGEKK